MQKIKGFDGRASSAVEFYSCESGTYTYSVKCEGIALSELFGPSHFVLGKAQNIRSRFTSPKQETAYLADCLKAFDTFKKSNPRSTFDAVPVYTYALSSDLDYMTDVKAFLAARVAEFSDEQVSSALSILSAMKKGWVEEFQTIVAAAAATAASAASSAAAKPVVEKKRNFARFAVKPTTAAGGAGASS
jgi:hypothetical protein